MTPHRTILESDPQTPMWRVTIVHKVAAALGLLIHIKGLPIGSTRLLKRFPDACDRDVI